MEYSTKIVFFMDILGFKNLIKSNQKSENIASILSECYNVFPKDNYSRVKISHFSDSVIISLPPELNKENGNIFNLLNYLSILQKNLVYKHDTLIRGGICLGKIYHDKKFVFGEGVNQSYQMESELAIYPRIIVDNSVISAWKNNMYNDKNFGEESDEKYINQFIKKDFDGRNYLDYIEDNNLDDLSDYIDFLNKLKTFIETNLKNKNENVLQKYLWLKEKYNIAVKNVNEKTKYKLKFLQ